MNADDKIELLIREIASKHGIAVARDDPILVLQTINHRLLQDSVSAQQKLLTQYKEEIEALGNRWGMDAHEKAERVLNAALDASRESMAQMADISARSVASTVTDRIAVMVSRMEEASSRGYVAAVLNLSAACVTAIAVAIFMVLR
ncbi:conjugal transfer protein TraM [Duganella sp. Leaf61]|uniref:conjugal transfer protein TraM n=1 Tax=Duganella sp. Leaf61 TaxID=1736227 RepID=UPI0006FDEB38|nr:conjugal transfer protein TraM [Duganella sp. Leaf61]KQN65198.1 conjugal transfer protein TraM [Duganella sp. Leaf61]